jgi:hypothetical protein
MLKTTFDELNVAVKVNASFAVRRLGPEGALIESVMTGVPIPVVGSVVVPLKTPWSVYSHSPASAAGASDADNPTETAAAAQTRATVLRSAIAQPP